MTAEELAASWILRARRLRDEAGVSMATPDKLRRARADQLELCASELLGTTG